MPAAAFLTALIPSLYHLEFLLWSRVQSQEDVWSQAWDPLALSLWHCIPRRGGLFCFFPLSYPTPTLLTVYNKLLSCKQKKQALGRIWLCCLELFMAYFGLSKRGHKYTVNLPDSKNSHLGPKRLTTCETQKPHLSCTSQLCARPALCGLDGGLMLQLPLGHFLSFAQSFQHPVPPLILPGPWKSSPSCLSHWLSLLT